MTWSVAALAAATVFGVHASEAKACGGTFCDSGPTTTTEEGMPVDQTGETIIFVVEDDFVEAHIQIQYDPETDAEKFAWLVPVMGQPEIGVGSERLFINALNGSVPAYGLTVTTQSCGGGGGGGGGGGDWDECSSGGDTNAEGTTGDSGGTGGVDTTGGGTEVVAEASVGAFDYVVLQSQTAEELMTWLGDNGFSQDPEAEPILQEYVDEGALFVAFRLNQAAQTGEIHPVSIRYEGTEPCVPIRLTRIAAQDDMDIRVLFFGEARVVPTNYRHVELNPLLLDWRQSAMNYKEIVTLAVDSEMSEGQGFVTEYSGPSAVVSTEGVYDERWNAEAFSTLTPSEVLYELQQQGFGGCFDDVCEWQHPLIEGVLLSHLPVPEGVDPAMFLSCLECYDGLIDMDAWDPAALAADLDERIIAPGLRAVEIVNSYPVLTRMYTTISPHEMTQDPFFHENADLPGIDLTAVAASINVPCGGQQSASVPSTGTTSFSFAALDLSTWPMFEDMPAAVRVEEIPEVGAPITLIDNEAAILEALELWQSMYARTVNPRCHDGWPDDSDTDGAGAGADGDDSKLLEGCGCRADGGTPWSGLLLLGLMALRIRRRRG
jgi:hypothetical protein